MTGLISIITTTYDREDALDSVLRGLSRQADRAFEVVIADDGSGPPTAALIERWKSCLGVPLIHVRQEHRGFRAAAIRNRALRASRGLYCIFLDGDCIPRPDFIAAHRSLAEPGSFVAGNLVFTSTLERRTFALRVSDGKILWRLNIGKYSPGIVTERHYFFTLNGIVMAWHGRRSPQILALQRRAAKKKSAQGRVTTAPQGRTP